MKKWEKLLDLDAYLSGIFLAVMLVIGTSGVLSRYILPTPLQWSEELSRFCLMYFAYLSCSYCVGTGSHLVIDLVPNQLFKNNKIARRIIRLFGDVMFIIFAVFLIYWGWKATVSTFEISPGLGLPMQYVYISLPIGMTWTTLRLVIDMIKTIRGDFDNVSEGDAFIADADAISADARGEGEEKKA